MQDGYHGEVTHNRSYLPRQNSDVLYFALGPVSASTLHSLFDRKTDTAIDFTPDSVLARPAGDSGVLALTMPVPGNAIVRVVPQYFTKTLGVPYYQPFNDSVFGHAPIVWSSWTSYYEAVREEDIVKNADWLGANLKPYGFQFVQLDDGYDRDEKGQHYWIENWDRQKFPHGPQWLTNYIKSKGLRAGIWLVPNAYAGAVQQHPEWYLRYQKDGRIITDYRTPALDATNPQALEQVKKIMTTLDDWGFDYYKFDGEHALPRYVPGVDRSKLHDPNVDPLVNYRARLKMIRETIGPNRFIEGCPAGTPLNGIGYFDSYFTGHDLYNNWQGMYPFFSSINANGFLNHLVVYVMPGEGLELGTPMTVEEAKVKRPKIVVETARTREESDDRFRPRRRGGAYGGHLRGADGSRLSPGECHVRTTAAPGAVAETDHADPADPARRSLQPRYGHAVGHVQTDAGRLLHPQLSGNSRSQGECRGRSV